MLIHQQLSFLNGQSQCVRINEARGGGVVKVSSSTSLIYRFRT